MCLRIFYCQKILIHEFFIENEQTGLVSLRTISYVLRRREVLLIKSYRPKNEAPSGIFLR